MPESPQQPLPLWYKTTAGKIFLSVLVAILVVGVAFLALVGYFYFQIQQGRGEEIARSFIEEFTVDPSVRQDLTTHNLVRPGVANLAECTADGRACVSHLVFARFDRRT